MGYSVLEAIKQGIWDFEPDEVKPECFDSTEAMPGTYDKVSILAERVRRGLPLWHPEDRRSYDEKRHASSQGHSAAT